MTFPINTTIPAAGNDPSIDQQPMQTNFANINSYLGVDHTTPGTNPGDGQHNQVTFHLNQAAPSIANGVSGLFSNMSQLFFQNAAALYQMTNLPIVTGANTGTAGGTLNYFDTPWNMRVYFGKTGGISGGTVLFTPIANYTTLFFALATCNDGNAHYVSTGQFPSQLTLKADATVSSIVWFAIGRL
jgi:hypothetical protein